MQVKVEQYGPCNMLAKLSFLISYHFVSGLFRCRWLQSKAELVEPIDYETVTVKNKTVLQNDPQRELLLFPHDDVSVSVTFMSVK